MTKESDDTFCIYCQKEYGSVKRLATHLRKAHAGTYADQHYNHQIDTPQAKADNQ